jgi:hypothetical protein
MKKLLTIALIAVFVAAIGRPANAQFGLSIVYDPTNYANAVLRYSQLIAQLNQLRATYRNDDGHCLPERHDDEVDDVRDIAGDISYPRRLNLALILAYGVSCVLQLGSNNQVAEVDRGVFTAMSNPEFNETKQLYLEKYGDAVVTSNYLRIAVACFV